RPDDIAGLGPFRLERVRPGEEIVLARNPNYWKQDRAHNPLPYLARLTFAVVPSEEAQVIRLRAGELDVLNRVGSQHATTLDRDQSAGPYQLHDLGPSLEYHFLFFNQNDPAPGAAREAGLVRRRALQAGDLARDRSREPGAARLQRPRDTDLGSRDARQPAVGEHRHRAAAGVAAGRARAARRGRVQTQRRRHPHR